MYSPNQPFPPKNSININSNKSSKILNINSNSNRSSCDDEILLGNFDDLNLINNTNKNSSNKQTSSTNNNNIDSLLMHSPSPPHNLLSYVQHQNYSQQLLQLQQQQHSHQHHNHQQQQAYQYQQQNIPQLSNISYRKVRPEPIK